MPSDPIRIEAPIALGDVLPTFLVSVISKVRQCQLYLSEAQERPPPSGRDVLKLKCVLLL